MVEKEWNAREKLLILIEKLNHSLCYTKYLASRLNMYPQNVSAILGQLHLQGKVAKNKSVGGKVFYRLTQDFIEEQKQEATKEAEGVLDAK